MRISQLDGRRVALWGFGREGRAAHAAIRRRLPEQPLTLFCPEVEVADACALGDSLLDVRSDITPVALSEFDVIVKSPGISPYREPATTVEARLTSGTALWFAEHLPGLKLCVTGTKGKSTTTALIAHLLRRRGLAVALAGNIGLPLLELLDPPLLPAVWAIELSSYQTCDAQAPDVALLLNLYPEHMDWHGSEQRYFDDKLKLVTRATPRCVVLNHLDPRLREFGRHLPGARWFGRDDGWHLRGDTLYRADEAVFDTRAVPLPGAHNRLNLCAALAAIEALGFDARPLSKHAESFTALPHRLQTLGTRDGITYVNDSISTTPHASIAALECFRGRPTVILVGGFERGLPWAEFADHLRQQPPRAVIVRGQNGARIAAEIEHAAKAAGTELLRIGDLGEAVATARQRLGQDGVVLLSPGAPSFPEFRDYTERGRAFAGAAGFDAQRISRIPGLGIA